MQSRDYLGPAPKIQVRDPSFDGQDSEGFEQGYLTRQDSRTPLTPPQPAVTQNSGGEYFFSL